MPYELPPLPYAYDALEPTIDAKTMEIHHDKHHQAYVTNLNTALEGTEWADRPIEQVIANLDALPEDKRMAVRNNGGGHVEPHALLGDDAPGRRRRPVGRARARRSETPSATPTSSRRQVNDAGVKRFGSGWTWLVWDGTGLAVSRRRTRTTRSWTHDVPLLGIDVWEHAYYLKYQNRRPDYLAAWWDVVNWDEVARRFDEARR